MKTVEDLQPWEERKLEQSYTERPPRESDGSKRQSRQDFTAGWLACLEAHHMASAFKK